MESVTQPRYGKSGSHHQCSTPSGIMESVTLTIASAVPRSHHGAQRLPASWNRSPFVQGGHQPQVFVLNAFRHHGIGHAARAIAADYAKRCSTPSGIMESVTRTLRESDEGGGGCSTPSGIMESVTFSPSGNLAGWRKSAQRLPASWNRSRDPFMYTQTSRECSTPSGIMESVTLPARV